MQRITSGVPMVNFSTMSQVRDSVRAYSRMCTYIVMLTELIRVTAWHNPFDVAQFGRAERQQPIVSSVMRIHNYRFADVSRRYGHHT